jgi:hypothetical protein
MYRVLSFLGAIIFLIYPSPLRSSGRADEYKNVPGLMHLDSNISGGNFSPGELAEMAREKGFKIVVITDHDTNYWEYGLQPLRKILKKSIERGSILRYGVERYLEIFQQLNIRYPDMVSIHAAEAIPFYYWEGNYFKKNLVMRNGHKHLLVIGLNTASDYKNLPSVGNGFPYKFSWIDILGLWPIVFIIWAVRLLFLRRRTLGAKKLEPIYSCPYKWLGAFFFLVGILFLYNNYPFSRPVIDQYHGDQGITPYQMLINYVNEKNGLVFWAHPETHQYQTINGINLLTEPYYLDLLKAKNYTGFAVFWEGSRYIGKPGGIWDQILIEYCEGKRENSIWAIAEAEYETSTFPIEGSQTVFLLKEINRRSVLEALKKGKMYAVCGPGGVPLILDEFAVIDKAKQKKGVMGDELSLSLPAFVSIKISDPSFQRMPYTIRLIRNGKVIKTFSGLNQTNLEFEDDYFKLGEKLFYRLEIEGRWKIVSNPIFVRFIPL